jgi:hypothetical protein
VPQGHGKLQRRLLEQLQKSTRPLSTIALSQGCGASEIRRAMGKLVLEGLVRKVRPDVWAAQRSEGSAGAASRRGNTPAVPAAPAAPTALAWKLPTVPRDPLLTLLRRYEAELAAFDGPRGEAGAKRDWDRIAKETWSRTQDEILERQTPATTAAGALLALDHVLKNDDIFAERTECADQQMLWLLVKAARDYIALMEERTNNEASGLRSAAIIPLDIRRTGHRHAQHKHRCSTLPTV